MALHIFLPFILLVLHITQLHWHNPLRLLVPLLLRYLCELPTGLELGRELLVMLNFIALVATLILRKILLIIPSAFFQAYSKHHYILKRWV